MRIVVYALVIAAVAIGGWLAFFRESDVDKGLLALNEAYRQQRPLEARISEFDYAPFSVTRGNEPEHVDSLARDRAERILLDAVRNQPSAGSYHALGKLYLAKKDFDKAIGQFDQALKIDPSNAKIYADLGAAWLEKGKISLEISKSNEFGPKSGDGIQELGRSLDDLNKSLELDNSLLEPLFNRPLAEQYLALYDQAEIHWRDYLNRDSTSLWAEDARRNLKLLEMRKARTANTKQQLLEQFVNAYETGNDEAAWIALSLSRARTGNAIVEATLNDLLRLTANGEKPPTAAKLSLLSYAGILEEQRAHDRFTLDLAQVYNKSTLTQLSALAQARAMMKSAVELYNRSEYAQAIELFSKARELFARSGNDCETLFAEAWIGYCHLRIPDPLTSIQAFERLSRIFEARNYRSLFAQTLSALADAVNAQNEYSRVLEFSRRSLVVSEQIQDRANAVRCLLSITIVQNIFGDYREALAASFHALSLAETLPFDAKLSWPFYHESSAGFHFIGMPVVALEFENEALRLARDAGLQLQVTRSYDRRALIFERLKNYEEAINNSQLARDSGKKITDNRVKTNVLAHSALNFARLYRVTGKPVKAVAAYDEALKLYGEIKIDTYQYQAHKGKLLALLASNNDEAAEVELNDVLYWFEQNREKIAEESYRNKFFDTDQDTYDIAVDFQYSRKKNLEQAFDYAENYRARSLLDLMSTDAKSTGEENVSDIKLTAGTSPLRLSQVQSQIPEKTQLLEFAVLDNKIVSWVVTKSEVRSGETQISRADLDGQIQRYLSAVSHVGTSTADEVSSQARALYGHLIAPVENYLDRNLILCIVPDKNLSFLPFAALRSPAGKYLIEEFTLLTAPSATVFINASQTAGQRAHVVSDQLLIVGNPRFDRRRFVELPDLPGATREAEGIARIYEAQPLIGEAASSTRVERGLQKVDVVHLATHALADERQPLQSKLLLSVEATTDRNSHHASRGFLQALDIYRMKFPRLRLAILSACQTGIERAYRGEGAVGLARPFIAGGVPLVVASLWPVESETTADLMISFHRYRKREKLSTIAALRRAQLEALHNQQPNSTHDFGWAAFVAIGGYASF